MRIELASSCRAVTVRPRGERETIQQSVRALEMAERLAAERDPFAHDVREAVGAEPRRDTSVLTVVTSESYCTVVNEDTSSIRFFDRIGRAAVAPPARSCSIASTVA